jgi:branched-chain amino acid transport system substrate-binding protein
MLCLRRIPVALLLLIGLAGCPRKPEPQPILIGHLAPFSGPDKAIGEHAKQAILLAVEEVNKEGNRIAGRRLAVLHPAYPPDEPGRLQPLAVRLITVDKVVALLGGLDANQTKNLGRAAQPYDVPVVTPSELPPDFVTDNVYSVNAGLTFQGQVLARFVKKDLAKEAVERVVILVDSGKVSAMSVADAFDKEFTRSGGRVHRFAYKSANDFSAMLGAIKKAQPGALLLAGSVGDLGRLRARLMAAGLNLPLVFGGDGEHLAALAADRDACKGVYVAVPYLPEGGTSRNQEFNKQYRERFQQAPDLSAALAYDGVRVLFEAMRRAKGFQPLAVRTELGQSSENPFESLTGPLTFDRNRVALRPLFVVRLEDGQLLAPKVYPPDGK